MKISIMFFVFAVLFQGQAWGLIPNPAGGLAQVPYLIRLVTENVKRYHQLRSCLKSPKLNPPAH